LGFKYGLPEAARLGQRRLASKQTWESASGGFGVKILSTINQLAGAMVSLVLLAILGAVAWFLVRTQIGQWAIEARLAEREAQVQSLQNELDSSRKQIAALNKDLEAKLLEIQRLDTALRLLKVDHRVAQIDVISQQGSAETKDLTTTFSFVELDASGKPIEKPRLFTVQGDMVYVDALVVKFSDEAVEVADPLRATSFCLFRRVFGEHQQPKDGFPLDQVGDQPAAYRGGREPSDFEREIWSKFWHYANHPEEAAKKGIRAAHGEAPFQKLVPGKRYKVLLRSSGGLSFSTEDLPLQGSDKAM
jgi:hypothetical protein